MSDSPGQSAGHQDVSDPIDGLRRVVTVISSGQFDLDPEDVHAVSRLSADAEPVVRELLAALDSAGRFALLERFVQIGSESGGYDFTAILATMASDEDDAVRSLAVNGLAMCETAKATETLVSVAKSEEETTEVRREAVIALGDVAMRVELGWASGEGADGVIDELRTLAEDPLEDEQIRAVAVSGVGVFEASWVRQLIEDAFQSDDAALHLGAVQAMGRSADVSWLTVLEGLLVAEDEDERLAAIQAIGEIGSEDGTPMLLELFDDASASEAQLQAAVAALGEIGGEEAVEELQQLRTHPDPTVRSVVQSAIEEATMLDSFEDLDDFGDLAGAGLPEGWRDE